MKENSRNFLVGVFVVASVGALGVLMVWFGEAPTWLRTTDWELNIIGVRDLRGVAEGTPVKLNGVEIGRVSSLDFRDRDAPEKGVVIRTLISRGYSVPMGAHAKVYGATLGIGSGQINIVFEENVTSKLMPQENATMRGEMASMLNEVITPSMVESFQRMLDTIGNVAVAVEPVALSLDELIKQRSVANVDDPQPGAGKSMANISTVVERMDDLIANMNVVLGDVEVQGDIKGVVLDLKDTSATLKETVEIWKRKSTELADDATGLIAGTETKLDGSFNLLDELLAQAGEAATGLVHLINGIEQGRGTAGLIAKDERLYEAAVLALDRLNVVLADFAIISGKIRDDGYITISQASPVGPPILRKNFKTPGGSKKDRQAKMAAQP